MTQRTLSVQQYAKHVPWNALCSMACQHDNKKLAQSTISPSPPGLIAAGLNVRVVMFSRFGNFLKLRNLSVAGNRLESIPPSFGNLLHLDRVVLDCNSLRRLPETLGRMKCRWLNVSNNKLVRKLENNRFPFSLSVAILSSSLVTVCG